MQKTRKKCKAVEEHSRDECLCRTSWNENKVENCSVIKKRAIRRSEKNANDFGAPNHSNESFQVERTVGCNKKHYDTAIEIELQDTYRRRKSKNSKEECNLNSNYNKQNFAFKNQIENR